MDVRYSELFSFLGATPFGPKGVLMERSSVSVGILMAIAAYMLLVRWPPRKAARLQRYLPVLHAEPADLVAHVTAA